MKGARRITPEELTDLNLHLLKRHPDVRLYNIININREYSANYISWTFVKKEGHITCAMTYDERDFYYNLYGDANDVAELLRDTLDFDAAELGDFKGLAFHYLFATMAQDVTNALKTEMSKLNKRPVTDATFELWIMDDLSKASLALNKHMNGDELTPDYQIGMVHTKSAFRGRGLGKAVIADLSLKVAQLRSEDTSEGPKSAIVHSYIDPQNIVSKKLHADLGYKYHGTNYTWIRI